MAVVLALLSTLVAAKLQLIQQWNNGGCQTPAHSTMVAANL
jgi:hypothetical protein